MENDKEELLNELMAIEVLVKENPCRMKSGLIRSLIDVIHSFIGKQCVEGASRDQVAIYLERDVRTITRWKELYDDFPKARHDGHKEISYNWIEIVQWKLKHSELYTNKEKP